MVLLFATIMTGACDFDNTLQVPGPRARAVAADVIWRLYKYARVA